MTKSKISPSIYKKFIRGLELEDLKVAFAKASVKESFKPPAVINVEIASSYKQLKNNRIKVIHEYNLECTKEGKDKTGFIVEVRYIVVYSSKTPMTKELFKIFSESSLLLHTWPYFRQYVHQMTFLMKLPPLVLSTIKIFA